MKGPYHYEDIPSRGKAKRYRVANFHNDAIRSFATEKEAKAYVRKLNDEYEKSIPKSWRFG